MLALCMPKRNVCDSTPATDAIACRFRRRALGRFGWSHRGTFLPRHYKSYRFDVRRGSALFYRCCRPIGVAICCDSLQPDFPWGASGSEFKAFRPITFHASLETSVDTSVDTLR